MRLDFLGKVFGYYWLAVTQEQAHRVNAVRFAALHGVIAWRSNATGENRIAKDSTVLTSMQRCTAADAVRLFKRCFWKRQYCSEVRRFRATVMYRNAFCVYHMLFAPSDACATSGQATPLTLLSS